MTGPQEPAASGDGRLMAGHSDLEQVIETLKDALVQSRLTRDELGARAAQALAVLTADIPGGHAPVSRVTKDAAGGGAGSADVMTW
jgi:hypothetical protein